jgi:thioredoxin 1
MSKFGIMAIPTMIFFKNGQEVHRIQGAGPKRMLKEAFDAVVKA